MWELSDAFLSTIAQVSATFIGFALLTPIFQAVALVQSGGEYIRRKIFLKKWLLLLTLPIFVLSYPLIISLLELRNQDPSTLSDHRWTLLFIAIFIRYYINVRSWDFLKEIRSKFDIIIKWTPLLLICICAVIPISYFIQRPLMGLDWILVLFLMTGFLLVLQNTGVSIQSGIKFGKEDIDPRFDEAKRDLENKIKKAIDEREEKVIKKMNLLINKIQRDLESNKELTGLLIELIRSRGSQEAEIENLKILIDGISNLCIIIYKKPKLIFNDFSEFEDRRKDGEERMEKFVMGTTNAEKILDSIENADVIKCLKK